MEVNHDYGRKSIGFLRGVQGEGVFLGNPEDSGQEDWGTEQGRLGESPPLRMYAAKPQQGYHHQSESPIYH